MDSTFLDAPELFRKRANGAATLVLTAAAALGAGIVFREGDLTADATSVFAAAAFVLLLASFVAFLNASVYSRPATVPAGEAQQAFVAIATSIEQRMRVGFALGVAGAAAFAVLSVVVLEPPTLEVEAVLGAEELDALRSTCDGAANPLVARVARADLRSSSPLIELEIVAGVCGPDPTRCSLRATR